MWTFNLCNLLQLHGQGYKWSGILKFFRQGIPYLGTYKSEGFYTRFHFYYLGYQHNILVFSFDFVFAAFAMLIIFLSLSTCLVYFRGAKESYRACYRRIKGIAHERVTFLSTNLQCEDRKSFSPLRSCYRTLLCDHHLLDYCELRVTTWGVAIKLVVSDSLKIEVLCKKWKTHHMTFLV